MALIEVQHLVKRFRVPQRRSGPLGGLRSLVSRDGCEVVAVDDLSFSVERGEMIGYVGPNGAGKSTTIKILTGILVPSSGSVCVDGLVPWRQRTRLAARFGVVFGQRTQLWWDLPLIESLRLLSFIYQVPAERFERNLRRLTEMLELGPLLNRPVRQLSLGQRMRGDLAAALLHEPLILFLDEPTIGLDVVAKERIRRFLLELNDDTGVTVLLTTHDMGDIAHLCRRLLILDHGRLIYDGSVEQISTRFGGQRRLVVDLDEEVECPEVAGAAVERRDGNRLWLTFQRDQVSAPELIARLAARYRIRDLTIEEPDVEHVVRRIYEEGIT